MLIRQIALLSSSKKVSIQELMTVSAALQRQVTRDLYPIWNIKATVDAFPTPDDVPPDYWKVTVMDTIPAKNAAGFHLDANGQPYADVLWSDKWSLTASHECLEMLVDPWGHHVVAGPSPIESQGRVKFLLEVCDPCEGEAYAYTINTGGKNEILVSDFYTPDYFAPRAVSGGLYSFRGNISAPRQVLNGGYLSWQSPSDGHIWQLYGPAELKNFKDQGPGSLDRQKTDSLTNTTRSASVAKAAPVKPPKATKVRGAMALATAAAGGQCNLTRNGLTGLLSGSAGDQTTVQIKDASGAATFQSISYDGTQLGSNVTSASFTIKSGGKDLTFTYAAPTPGVNITIEDPCGTLVDFFTNNLASPVRLLKVVGA